MNGWLVAGFLAALIIVGAGGYHKGLSDGDSICEARFKAVEKASQEAKDAEAAKATKAATDLEKDNADADAESRTREIVVTKIVERPVYRDRCFDDDGLSVANAALTGTRTASPVAPIPVPRPAAP